MAVVTKRGFLRQAWDLAWPYWNSEEKWAARGLLLAVIALNLITVGLNVRLNSWNNDFYDALQQYNWPEFWRQFAIFGIIAFLLIVVAVYSLYLTANTAYPLAPLADRPLFAQLAGRPSLLPDAVGPDDDRQPRSTHLR